MNKQMIIGGALSGLVLAGGVAGMVSAQSVATATGLTEEQVIAIALEEIPGEVLDVELEHRRNMHFYEVAILAADGTEMEVEVAAQSGDVLKVKAEGEGCNKGDEGEEEA